MFSTDAKWVWMDKQEEADEYVSFLESYESDGTGRLILKIVSEINYIAYVNGKRAAYGQFPGYRHEKYVEEVDITDFSRPGRNELRIVVHYEGLNTTLNHIQDKAGVIFEVCNGDRVLCCSTEETLAGLDTAYQQHVCRLITGQLGYSINMSAREDAITYRPCRTADRACTFLKRPVKKLVEEEKVYGSRVDIPGKLIFDFGRETAGYVSVKLQCKETCDVILTYGEHLADGEVRRIIGERDFSFHLHCQKGENCFEQFFVRMAGRYVEILGCEETEVEWVGIVPVLYPMEEKEIALTGLDKKIYDVCVRTLRLCMHEHYEDCPWREQALYVLDSRNQMAAGYYAFKDTSFARANLVFISKGVREDGLLELCYPAEHTPAIPFFSLMYPVTVSEYIEYTGDSSILDEVMPTIEGIIMHFAKYIKDTDILENLPAPYWNFYEWSEGSDGTTQNGGLDTNCEKNRHDLILNCAFLYAAKHYQKLCALQQKAFDMDLEPFREAVGRRFYDSEKGMYFLSDVGPRKYSQLGNAFAKLVGLKGEHLKEAVEGLGDVVPVTLSMKAFVYDALMMDGKAESREYILNDIRKEYGYMLEQGATSFWETIEGEKAFNNAGSLCHGWSALPVYYYHQL